MSSEFDDASVRFASHRLENVELVHRENPRTYSIPRSDQRYHLRAGQIVKLVFLLDTPGEDMPHAERMWVEVKEVVGIHYVGVLDNDPRYITNLKAGDIVEFGPEHISAVYLEPGAAQLPLGQYAWVSRNLLREDAWPRRLFRRPSADSEFSGWWLLNGDEIESELLNGENFVAYAVDDILTHFRVLDSVLDEPAEADWYWNTEAVEYQLVKK